jgi:succinate dehydrogenase / fumarate reductase, cytochrome b subunit
MALKPVERPLSPHLQVYRMPLSAITSILVRITGNALIVAAALAVWWLVAAATSDAAFDLANSVATGWFGDLVFSASVLGLWYHYLGGLRHLYFDAGHGLDVKTADRLGWGMILGALVLTALTLAIV